MMAEVAWVAPKVGVLVVLYHPSQHDLTYWLAWRQSCDVLLLLDNAEDPDMGLQQQLRAAGMSLLANQNRGGLAGAYNRGMAWLLAQGCGLTVLFDQDSRPQSDFMQQVLSAAQQLGDTAYLLGAKIYETRLARAMPVMDPKHAFKRPIPVDQHDRGLFPAFCVISSGSVIPAQSWKQLGTFREDYFIESIDIEYALRAWHQQIPVYLNAAMVLAQSAGDIVSRAGVYSTQHPAWRRYYMSRNLIHALRLYPGRRAWLFAASLLLLYQACGIIRLEASRGHKLQAMLLGLWDGWRAKLGRLALRHPRLALRWRGP